MEKSPKMEMTSGTVSEMYYSRKLRLTHPEGHFDKAGRWWPSDREQYSCCNAIRTPSRAYPFSLMVHCRTRKHVANLLEV